MTAPTHSSPDPAPPIDCLDSMKSLPAFLLTRPDAALLPAVSRSELHTGDAHLREEADPHA